VSPVFTVDDAGDGERIDRHLAALLGKPRNQVQRWIAEGRVTVGGQPVKPSMPLAAGDEIDCRPPEAPREAGIEPEAGPLRVLHEDPELVVLDKPAGVVVHPGAGHRRATLAHFLLHRYPEIAGVGGPGRPGIVHRLDLDTSGVLVAARTEAAYLGLTRAFAEREVEKRYLAIVYGTPKEESGGIDLPIGRHPRERKRMDVRADGRAAHTRYHLRATGGGVSLLEIDLETGRTHQIRVHLKALGHPLVGDPVYGERRWRGLPGPRRGPLARFPRPALHAWRITFTHPVTGRPVAVEAPVPDDLRRLWREVTRRGWPEP